MEQRIYMTPRQPFFVTAAETYTKYVMNQFGIVHFTNAEQGYCQDMLFQMDVWIWYSVVIHMLRELKSAAPCLHRKRSYCDQKPAILVYDSFRVIIQFWEYPSNGIPGESSYSF